MKKEYVKVMIKSVLKIVKIVNIKRVIVQSQLLLLLNVAVHIVALTTQVEVIYMLNVMAKMDIAHFIMFIVNAILIAVLDIQLKVKLQLINRHSNKLRVSKFND